MTDLSIFDYETPAEKGFTVQITHPVTGKPVGVSIDVVGKDSQTFERAQAKFLRATKGLNDDDREGALKAACQLLTDCTLDWSGVEEDGKEVPFSAANALDIYSRFKGIREQLDRAIIQRSRLFQNTKEG